MRIPLNQIPMSGTHVVECEGRRVLLCRNQNGIHAMAEMCPHQMLSLDGGRVRGDVIMCPHHGARFSLDDGRSLSPLTTNGLTLYSVTPDGEDIVIGD
ncbi:Rieske (2Fe-2S) protein [Sphingobium sp.]|uniref:Rieske (2Fe-2S) protein n=1 Tax=Sphingobium sp. TaxID=1912891 RepID=UPI002B8E4F92|nr:Rieske (2Fe-2S) protein [Sphingobium sp.]HUD94577.1 Rieske (2Fe-2S) protein [Sphingobium sp.]